MTASQEVAAILNQNIAAVWIRDIRKQSGENLRRICCLDLRFPGVVASEKGLTFLNKTVLLHQGACDGDVAVPQRVPCEVSRWNFANPNVAAVQLLHSSAFPNRRFNLTCTQGGCFETTGLCSQGLSAEESCVFDCLRRKWFRSECSELWNGQRSFSRQQPCHKMAWH